MSEIRQAPVPRSFPLWGASTAPAFRKWVSRGFFLPKSYTGQKVNEAGGPSTAGAAVDSYCPHSGETEVFVSALLSQFLDVTVSIENLSFTKVRRYTLADALNAIPELVVEVFSTEPDLDMADLVGRSAVAFLDEPAVPRFDGIVRHVEQRTLGIAGVSVYALTIVPRLWLTKKRSGHRIFQQRTALDILADVLEPYGPAMEKPEGVILQRVLPAYEYRVQCGESDEDFLFRILSEQGLVSCWAPDKVGQRHWIVTDDTPPAARTWRCLSARRRTHWHRRGLTCPWPRCRRSYVLRK